MTNLPVYQNSYEDQVQQTAASPQQSWSVYLQNNKGVIGIVVGVAILLVAGLVVLGPKSNSLPRSITVAGSAEKRVPAASAEYVVQFSVQNSDQAYVSQVVDAQYAAVSEQLESLETVTVSGSPTQVVPVQNPLSNQLGSYQAARSMRVTVGDITKAEQVKTILTSNKATVLQTLYEPSDPEVAKTEVHTAAFADAKQRAEQLAKVSGNRLGSVVTVVDNTTTRTSEVIDTGSSIDLLVQGSLGVTFTLQ